MDTKNEINDILLEAGIIDNAEEPKKKRRGRPKKVEVTAEEPITNDNIEIRLYSSIRPIKCIFRKDIYIT